MLFFTLNREDFSFVIHLDRQPRTSRRREAQTGSRARSGSRSERTLDAVEHSRTLMEWWPFLIFHRGGLRIKVINNTTFLRRRWRRRVDRHEAAKHGSSKPRNQHRVGFLRSTGSSTSVQRAGSCRQWSGRCRARAGLKSFPPATSWRIGRSSSFLGQQLLQPGVPLLKLLEALGIHARQ